MNSAVRNGRSAMDLVENLEIHLIDVMSCYGPEIDIRDQVRQSCPNFQNRVEILTFLGTHFFCRGTPKDPKFLT